MTLPTERTRAVQNTYEFLSDLMEPLVTPGVPQEIRDQARALLRHYPWDFHLRESAARAPDIWGKPEANDSREDLNRRLLLAFFTVAGYWNIDEQTASDLLGVNIDQMHRLKLYPRAALSDETQNRLSNLLHIHHLLSALFGDDIQRVAEWLVTPSDAPVFDGRAPIARMREGADGIRETYFFAEEEVHPSDDNESDDDGAEEVADRKD